MAPPESTDDNGDNDNNNGDVESVSVNQATSSPLPLAGGGGARGDVGQADGEERGVWWTRRFVREYLPPVGLGNPSLNKFLASHGLD